MITKYLIPAFQISMGLAGFLVFAFSPTYIVDSVKWRRQYYPNLPTVFQSALVGLGLGLIIGLITPFYLDVTGWWLLTLRFVGGALFFSLGVGHLASLQWSMLGTGFGQLGFSLFVHSAIVSPMISQHANPLLFKFIALAALGYAVVLIAIDFPAPAFIHRSSASGTSKAIAAWLSALLVILEFFNHIFGFAKFFRR